MLPVIDTSRISAIYSSIVWSKLVIFILVIVSLLSLMLEPIQSDNKVTMSIPLPTFLPIVIFCKLFKLSIVNVERLGTSASSISVTAGRLTVSIVLDCGILTEVTPVPFKLTVFNLVRLLRLIEPTIVLTPSRLRLLIRGVVIDICEGLNCCALSVGVLASNSTNLSAARLNCSATGLSPNVPILLK